MLDQIRIHGTRGSLVWGHRTAAELTRWRIVRSDATQRVWRLRATMLRVDRFQARQTPLLFTAPRPGGFWAWPISNLELGDTELRATLGPPEQ